MAKRDYPNTNFAWYHDEARLAILELDTEATSGERTQEQYDSFQSEDDVANGLRMTFHAKYQTIEAVTDDLKSTGGLDSGLHPTVVCYIKSRIYEDIGDLQKAQYFRMMYESQMKKYPLRKTGIRQLSVPRM